MGLLTVRHKTVYRYHQPVSFGEHRLMFRPRDSYDQKLIDATLEITPEPQSLRWIHDVFGNCVAVAQFDRRAEELSFESVITLDHSAAQALDFTLEEYAHSMPFSYSAEEMPDLLRSMERQFLDPEHQVNRWARQFLDQGHRAETRGFLAAMTREIHSAFDYVAREEQGTQDPATTLRLGSGSCRDFAVLMLEAVRSLGLAARFVSGYVYSPGTSGRRHQGGGSTHAWVQVYLPGAGWVEYDPTNGILGNQDLIRVAVARDPRQALPLSGSWTGSPADFIGMTVTVEVTESAELRQFEPVPVPAYV